jgi:hypothetical protein
LQHEKTSFAIMSDLQVITFSVLQQHQAGRCMKMTIFTLENKLERCLTRQAHKTNRSILQL